MPRKSWWARLPFGVRMTVGACALLTAIGGGAAGIAVLTGGKPGKPHIVSAAEAETPKINTTLPVRPTTAPQPSRSAPARPEPATQRHAAAGAPAAPRTTPTDPATPPTSAAPAASAPMVVTRTEVETRDIPFDTQVVQDPGLPSGTQHVREPGANGQETFRYLVTLTDGRQTARQLVDTTVIRQPQQRVVANGTRPPANRPTRECGHGALDLCVPLGRRAMCRQAALPPRAESTLLPGADVDVLNKDLLPENDFPC